MPELPPTADGRTIPERVDYLEKMVESLHLGAAETHKLHGETTGKLLDALCDEVASLRETINLQAEVIRRIADTIGFGE